MTANQINGNGWDISENSLKRGLKYLQLKSLLMITVNMIFQVEKIPSIDMHYLSLRLFLTNILYIFRWIGKTTEDVCQDLIKPLTSTRKNSYVDYLENDVGDNEFTGKPEYFISHTWRYKFKYVWQVLSTHFDGREDTIVWFDLLSNNQHRWCWYEIYMYLM